MGNLPVFVSTDGAQRMRRLAADLKKAGDPGKGLKREMRKEIREAGKPVVADIRRAVMAVQVSSTQGGTAHPDKSTRLRARVAKATGLSVTNSGIRIRVSGRKLGGDAKLAKYLDASIGRYERWRHPVFGNRENWVQQKGQPYFFVTIRKHTKDFRAACLAAMDKTADKIRG